MKNRNALRILAIASYTILFFLIGLFVFVANNENQPIREIFQPNYLIPAVIYSGVTLLVCYAIFEERPVILRSNNPQFKERI